MSTIKVDTIATRTGSGNITASNTIAGTSATLSGTLGITGNTTVGGTLVNTGLITASAGVAIGGTDAAHTLDDYEEGSWNPIVGGNATYNNQQGIYTKVGRLVFIRGDINVNVLGTGSATTLTGLPFSGNYQGTPQGMVSVGYFSNVAQNFTWLGGYVLNNSAGIYFSGSTSGATTIQVNGGNVFGNNARILFSAVYIAD